jgi:hypothetical protein
LYISSNESFSPKPFLTSSPTVVDDFNIFKYFIYY